MDQGTDNHILVRDFDLKRKGTMEESKVGAHLEERKMRMKACAAAACKYLSS